jgi:uncharacterized RDD family membrane protein YckC
MQTVRITTAQNVEIEYAVASIGDRILAAFIDYGILLGYLIGAIILWSFLPGGGSNRVALLVVLYLPFFFYDLLCEIFLDGQSLGKKQMKIKVIKMDGSSPDIGSYLLRWLLRVIDIALSSGGVAMLTILLNGKGQRLGDIAAGTTVIKLKEDVGLQDTIFTKITDAYQPVFAQAAELNDQDMAIVREVLNTGLEVESIEVGNNLEMKAKIVLEEKMRIKSDLPPRAFLSTILRDYNYFKGKL